MRICLKQRLSRVSCHDSSLSRNIELASDRVSVFSGEWMSVVCSGVLKLSMNAIRLLLEDDVCAFSVSR